MLTFDKYLEAIDAERVRLGWDTVKASRFLRRHFGKGSRLLLTDDELAEALGLLVMGLFALR